MTQQELNYYKAAASLNLIPDDENVLFMFNSTHKDILMDIISGKIDPIKMARMELHNRGLDEKSGKWIGWTSNAMADVFEQ